MFYLVMLKYSVILLFCLVNLSTAQNGNSLYQKIYGGTRGTIHEATYLVFLQGNNGKDFHNFCGGALITHQNVVTAAHCVVHISDPGQLTVVAGTTFLNRGGIRRRVNKIITPKDYNMKTLHNDLAVLKLEAKMPSFLQPLKLCTEHIPIGTELDIFGWGNLRNDDPRLSNQMLKIKAPIMDWENCKSAYNRVPRTVILKGMFCLSNAHGQDTCEGDSGSPAVYNNQLFGVVSWGKDCGDIRYPAVYTNVTQLKNFITAALLL